VSNAQQFLGWCFPFSRGELNALSGIKSWVKLAVMSVMKSEWNSKKNFDPSVKWRKFNNWVES
jgi:hypothetical protein